MAITYSAGAGTQITTHAMNETLGSQTQQTGNNTVVVSDVLSVIGNGQIGSGTNGIGDSYLGRFLIIDLGLSTEQRRMCTADAAGTGTTRILTVHEDWDTNPVATTDTIHVAYEPADVEDGGAGGGINLNAKTGLFELSRVITINNTGGFQLMKGIALESDDTASAANFIVQSGGYYYQGYESSGAFVDGGVQTMYENTAGELGMDFQSGSYAYIYDCLIWAQLVTQGFQCDNGSNVFLNRARLLFQTQECHLYDATVIDCSITGKATSSEIVRVDAGTVCDGLVLSNVQVLDSLADTTTETIELEGVLFSGVAGYVDVRQNKTWNLIDPVWDVTTYTQLTWTGTSTGNELNDRRAIKGTVQEADGTSLQNALINVYEDTVLADLVLELTTDANGYAEDSFIYKKHATNSATTTYGGHALQAGKWLYLPFVATQTSTSNFNGTIVLSPDNNIVQTTQATALTDGSGITWSEPTNPTELVDFTIGSGTLAVGMILTFTPSGAVGTLRESASGDSTAGELYLDTRNATAIANGDTFSRTGGTAGTFSGTYTNNSKQPFTISINGNAKSLQTIYDYLAAKQNETTLSADGELIWEWCRSAQTQPFYATGSSFYTEQSNSKGIYVYNRGAGTLDYLTDDAGTTWTPPSSTTFQVTVKNGSTALEGVAVRFEETVGSDITSGTTNSSGVFSYADTLGNRTINCIVRKKGYKYQEFNIVVTGDFDIPVSFIRDPSVNIV